MAASGSRETKEPVTDEEKVSIPSFLQPMERVAFLDLDDTLILVDSNNPNNNKKNDLLIAELKKNNIDRIVIFSQMTSKIAAMEGDIDLSSPLCRPGIIEFLKKQGFKVDVIIGADYGADHGNQFEQLIHPLYTNGEFKEAEKKEAVLLNEACIKFLKDRISREMKEPDKAAMLAIFNGENKEENKKAVIAYLEYLKENEKARSPDFRFEVKGEGTPDVSTKLKRFISDKNEEMFKFVRDKGCMAQVFLDANKSKNISIAYFDDKNIFDDVTKVIADNKAANMNLVSVQVSMKVDQSAEYNRVLAKQKKDVELFNKLQTEFAAHVETLVKQRDSLNESIKKLKEAKKDNSEECKNKELKRAQVELALKDISHSKNPEDLKELLEQRIELTKKIPHTGVLSKASLALGKTPESDTTKDLRKTIETLDKLIASRQTLAVSTGVLLPTPPIRTAPPKVTSTSSVSSSSSSSSGSRVERKDTSKDDFIQFQCDYCYQKIDEKLTNQMAKMKFHEKFARLPKDAGFVEKLRGYPSCPDEKEVQSAFEAFKNKKTEIPGIRPKSH